MYHIICHSTLRRNNYSKIVFSCFRHENDINMTLTLLLHMSYLLSWEHLSCLWMKSNYPQYNNFDSIQITCVCGVVCVYVWRLYSYDDMIYVCYYYIVLDVLHAHSIHSNLLLLCCYCWDSKYNVYHKYKPLSPSGIETRYKWSYFMR